MPPGMPQSLDTSSTATSGSGDAGGGYLGSSFNVGNNGIDVNKAIPWIVGGVALWLLLKK